MAVSNPFTRSAAVGLAATALDFGVLSVLVTGLSVPARLASLPALALGILVQFIGNKWLAFRDPSPGWVRQAGLFLAV